MYDTETGSDETTLGFGHQDLRVAFRDKTRQQLHGKQGHTSRIQQLQKKCLSLLEINSSSNAVN